MGFTSKFILLFSVLTVGWLAYKISVCLSPPALPHLDETAFWGSGNPKADDTKIKPFKINVPEKVIENLKERLNSNREFTPALEGIDFQYGFNTNTLKKVLSFWRNEYNWTEREAYLNKFPQYTTEVQGLNIHYLHIKPTTKHRTLPLILLHGWPGSVREFYELIPLLTNVPQHGSDFVFEVVVPSLPGYGFSQGASKPGLGPPDMAIVFKNLMKRLGHDKFYVQGGDWGAVIASALATIYPDHILGHHSNMCSSATNLTWLKLLLWNLLPTCMVGEQYRQSVSALFNYLIHEAGYFHIQATKPDTIGIALTDSPIGLAAYILEKFSTWTDPTWMSVPDGGLTKNYTYTDVLDNVMIYWVSNSITTSMRLYRENFKSNLQKIAEIPTPVPTACVRFKNELFRHPDDLLRDKYPNLVQSTDIPAGGHFAAFQLPYLLAQDIWKAVVKMEALRQQTK